MASVFGLIAGIAPVIALIVFGVILYKTKMSQNVATWVMWFVLDFVITISMFAAGNKEAWLPLGYTIGAFVVAAVLVRNGNWKWGFVETICALGSIMAMVLWYYSSPRGSVVVAGLAMWIASVPLVIDTWKKPDPSVWWFWGTAAVSSAIATIVARSWSIEDRFFPLNSCVFNTIMTLLVIRRPSNHFVKQTRP